MLLQLTEVGQTSELILCALQHVEEEIKQKGDLATTLSQRLVELSVLELLRHPKIAIQVHAQVKNKFRPLYTGTLKYIKTTLPL